MSGNAPPRSIFEIIWLGIMMFRDYIKNKATSMWRRLTGGKSNG